MDHVDLRGEAREEGRLLNRGVAAADDREFVLADIPGLIEGAHEGKGLGDRFLGHVERCRVLLHLIDGTAGADAAIEAYKTVRDELSAYGGGLADKPEVVALNKIDALHEEDIEDICARLRDATDQDVLAISGVSGANVANTLRALRGFIDEADVADSENTWHTQPWEAAQ